MAMCNHVLAVTGIDPARPWRGLYSDEAGATAIHLPYGGPLALVRHGMGLVGFKECAPADGLPVVADLMGHEVAGVMFGNRVGFMADGRGLVEMRAKVITAWAI